MFFTTHLIFPVGLFATYWATAGFPLSDTQKWKRIVVLIAVTYLPLKLMKILIHKDSGVLRNNRTAYYICFYLLVGVWFLATVIGFAKTGITAFIGSALVACALYKLWGNISGEEDSQESERDR